MIFRATQYVFRDPPVDPVPKKFDHIAYVDGYTICRNTLAFSRAFLVGTVEVVDSREAVFSHVAENDFEPARSVITDAPIEALIGEPGRPAESLRKR